jgi:pyridoxamine 5'-phosphate oxidase-like protein
MPTSFHDVIENYFTCEFTTLSRNGSPVTWPVTPRLLADGRFLLTTSIGLPQKAFNIRRNPKVSMLFSDPTGSGVTEPGALLIQGDASAEDRIVTDVSSDPDLEALMETVARRQPAGAFWSSWLGQRLMWPYYRRILIYVEPRRAFFWPTRDFTRSPEQLDLSECVVWAKAAKWLTKFDEAVLTVLDANGYPASVRVDPRAYDGTTASCARYCLTSCVPSKVQRTYCATITTKRCGTFKRSRSKVGSRGGTAHGCSPALHSTRHRSWRCCRSSRAPGLLRIDTSTNEDWRGRELIGWQSRRFNVAPSDANGYGGAQSRRR